MSCSLDDFRGGRIFRFPGRTVYVFTMGALREFIFKYYRFPTVGLKRGAPLSLSASL